MRNKSLQTLGSAVVVLVALGVLSGCATNLQVNSVPPGARVILDAQESGQITPAKLRLRDMDVGKHSVTVAMDGYTTVTPAKDFGVETHVTIAILGSVWLTPAFGIVDGTVNHCKGLGPDDPQYKETFREYAKNGWLTFELKKNTTVGQVPLKKD